jgi:hypothetical protein
MTQANRTVGFIATVFLLVLAANPAVLAIQQAVDQKARAAEAVRLAEQERLRQALYAASLPGDVVRIGIPQLVEPCVAQSNLPAPEFEVTTIPLKEWLAREPDVQIPWKAQVRDPELRMDQRHEVAYAATVRIKKDSDVFGGTPDLVFAGGVSGPDGEWLGQPRVARLIVDDLPNDTEVRFGGCVFLKPGDYTMWMALHDIETERYSVLKRRVRVSAPENDPLPELYQRLPDLEFPVAAGSDLTFTQVKPGPLRLPVANKSPLAIEIVAVVNPSEQWSARPDIRRSQSGAILAAASILSQIEPAKGSRSLLAVDVVDQTVPFRQDITDELDWATLAEVFSKTAVSQSISTTALKEIKNRGVFFRKFLAERLTSSQPAHRVLIVLSTSHQFERGSNLEPFTPEGDCNCSVYYLRLRPHREDNFEDLGRILRKLKPRVIDVRSAMEMRKALSQIIQDLSNL